MESSQQSSNLSSHDIKMFKFMNKPTWIKIGELAVARWVINGQPYYESAHIPVTGDWQYEAS